MTSARHPHPRPRSRTTHGVRRAVLVAVPLSMLLASVGCVHEGALRGAYRPPAGAPTPVVVSYQTDRCGGGGTLRVVLEDGEVFEGRYLELTSTTEARQVVPYYATWTRWDRWGPYTTERWVVADDWRTYRTNHSGRVVATLFSPTGHTLRCRLRLAKPGDGLEHGATGKCQREDGGTVEVSS